MGAIQIVKYGLVPGSPAFLIAAVAAGTVLLYVRPRAARIWFTALVLLYVAFSTGPIASLVEAPLARGYRDAVAADTVRNVDGIVVLGGGSTTFRARGEQLELPTAQSALAVLEGARLHRIVPSAVVIASGGRSLPDRQLAPESTAIRETLMRLGVPADRIVEESQSQTTWEQAVSMGPLLKRQGVRRFALVATPTHLWRAVRMFRKQGLDPVAAPAAQTSEGMQNARDSWVPSADALRASEAAMYHYLAIVYARLRGWL